MNKVIYSGRLVKDPEIRGEGEKAFVRFTLALRRKYRDKSSGEFESDFPMCKAFGKTAQFIADNFKKGEWIAFAGRYESGSYKDQKGNTVYTHEFIVEDPEFVGNKKDKSTSDSNKKYTKNSPSYDDDDEFDEEYERPKKNRRSEPEDEDDSDYPF